MNRLRLRAWPSSLTVAVLVALVLSLPGAARAAEWRTVSDSDGMLVERRPHEGSHFYEVRATASSPLPPAAIFETIWNQREHPQFVPYLKRLDVLSETGDERLTYEQVAVPLARDRDYTVRLRKRVDPDTQRYEIVFASANDAGPPPNRDYIRVGRIQGRWLVEPGANGKGARVSYELLTEPGGVIPAWVANRVQGEGAARLVRAMIHRTVVLTSDSR